MSWKNAQAEAQLWFDRIGVHKIREPGKALDLRPYADRLSATGRWREMILEAARRKMKAKDIAVILPD